MWSLKASMLLWPERSLSSCALRTNRILARAEPLPQWGKLCNRGKVREVPRSCVKSPEEAGTPQMTPRPKRGLLGAVSDMKVSECCEWKRSCTSPLDSGGPPGHVNVDDYRKPSRTFTMVKRSSIRVWAATCGTGEAPRPRSAMMLHRHPAQVRRCRSDHICTMLC